MTFTGISVFSLYADCAVFLINVKSIKYFIFLDTDCDGLWLSIIVNMLQFTLLLSDGECVVTRSFECNVSELSLLTIIFGSHSRLISRQHNILVVFFARQNELEAIIFIPVTTLEDLLGAYRRANVCGVAVCYCCNRTIFAITTQHIFIRQINFGPSVFNFVPVIIVLGKILNCCTPSMHIVKSDDFASIIKLYF